MAWEKLNVRTVCNILYSDSPRDFSRTWTDLGEVPRGSQVKAYKDLEHTCCREDTEMASHLPVMECGASISKTECLRIIETAAAAESGVPLGNLY